MANIKKNSAHAESSQAKHTKAGAEAHHNHEGHAHETTAKKGASASVEKGGSHEKHVKAGKAGAKARWGNEK